MGYRVLHRYTCDWCGVEADGTVERERAGLNPDGWVYCEEESLMLWLCAACWAVRLEALQAARALRSKGVA